MAQGEAATPTLLGLGVLGQPGYYPALTQWMALPWMRALGALGDTYRLSLSLYSGLLVLGTGALVRRVAGRSAGLAAGALVATVPILWMLRSEAMLDAPLAATLALVLAMVPVEGDRPHAGRATLAGLLLAGALLAKQTMLFFALPALALLVGRALWQAATPGTERRALVAGLLASGVGIGALVAGGWAFPAVWLSLAVGLLLLGLGQRRRSLPAWSHLRDVALVAILGAGLAGTWYARSAAWFRSGLEQVAATHDIATGAAGIVRSLGYTEHLWRALLPAPVALLLPLGLLLCWPLRSPRLLLALVALVGGFVGLSRFADLHSRHFAPLVPLLLLVAALPIGALSRWRPLLGRGVSGLVVIASVLFALTWRSPEHIDPRWQVGLRDADFAPDMPAHTLGELGRRMLRGPDRWVLSAPLPVQAQWPIAAAVAAVITDTQDQARTLALPPLQRGMVLLYADDAFLDAEGLLLFAEQAEVYWLDVRAPQQMPQLAVALAADQPALAYALELVARSGSRTGVASRHLDAAGFVELQRWPTVLPGRRGAQDLVLRRGSSMEGAGR